MKKLLNSCLSIAFIIIAIQAWAEPYQPTTSVTVITERLSDSTKREYLIQSTAHKTFFFAKGNSAHPVSVLTFQNDGSVTLQKSTDSPLVTIHSSLFLQGGFPLPIDLLPVNQQTEKKEYTSSQKSGGRVFKKQYTVSIKKISIEDALNNGWIALEQQKISAPMLKMITVTGKDNMLYSRQLWQQDEQWWFYEETRFRRSWRVR